MDCKFGIKTSLLIDGELAPEEAKDIKAHIADCSECREMETDFLYLRRQIKESASEAVLETLEDARLARPGERKTPMWKKWISLPAPAFVALLFLLATLGASAIFSTINRSRNLTAAEKPIEKTPLAKENRQVLTSELSLSRFDRGGRAEIRTARRQPSVESGGQESSRR